MQATKMPGLANRHRAYSRVDQGSARPVPTARPQRPSGRRRGYRRWRHYPGWAACRVHAATRQRGTAPPVRLPAAARVGLSRDRAGVAMKADVVKDQPADLRGMFGSAAGAPPAAAPLPELTAPFLLFCATSAR